jgi:hypothetical protein
MNSLISMKQSPLLAKSIPKSSMSIIGTSCSVELQVSTHV